MIRTIGQFLLYVAWAALFYKFLDAPLWATVGFSMVISLQLIPNKEEE